MANKKGDVSVMVQGLGMAMAFLQALNEEIVTAGGFEEMIHFLTKDTARPLVKKIAALIVESDWQIPRSLMERLAAECCENMEYVETDKRYTWATALKKYGFGVPIIEFSDPGRGYDLDPVPQAIRDQIIGKPASYPMIVMWEEEPYVVVMDNLYGPSSDFYEGKVVEVDTGFDKLSISPAKYFNLKQ